jgi:hypothetical protein
MASRLITDYPQSNQPPKIITCTDGTEVLVDAEDYPLLARHSWYINYSADKPYVITKMKTDQSTIWRCIFMHHMILGGGSTTDHKNGNTLDNQKYNLRSATVQENGWNTRKRMVTSRGTPPTSLYKGVSRYTNTNGDFLWRVIIKLTKKNVKPEKFLRKSGFKTEIEAAQYYDEEILKLRGKWAFLNFPLSKEGGSNG